MVDLHAATVLEPPDPANRAIRGDEWTRLAAFAWSPPDEVAYSWRGTATATTDDGTVGAIRYRLGGTSQSTAAAEIDGPAAGNLLLDWLNLGTGAQLVLLEGRVLSGVGSLRVMNAAGGVAAGSFGTNTGGDDDALMAALLLLL